MGPLEVQIWRLLKWPGHSLLFSKPSSLILENVIFIYFSLGTCQPEEMINGLDCCLNLYTLSFFVRIRFLVKNEGLFLGSSSAMNCV
jgi:hypothetical protein